MLPLAVFVAAFAAPGSGPETLTRDEIASGWRSMFDGKSLRGWSADAGNWNAQDGSIVRTKAGGGLTYVMYRLPADYEVRIHWSEKGGEWNTERIVCHGKVAEWTLNGVRVTDQGKGRVDPHGCSEFLEFPDRGQAIRYKGIYYRALLSSPPLFEEDLALSVPIRVKLWNQIKSYAEKMPPKKHTADPGASLLARFRAENGYPLPGLKGEAAARLEKIGEDHLATYYRCYVPVTPQLDAYGIYIVPKHATLPAPLVIAQHGNNGSPESAMFHGAGNYKDMIRGAAARGYVVYAPHLVTYSASDERVGAAIPEDVRQQLDKQLREKGASLTGVEATRIARALDALTKRPEVDRNRIAMIGLSLGGSTTLAMAALDERIKVAVVACGFRYAAVEAASPLTSSQLISAIAPRPLQIQAGRRDPLDSIQLARPAGALGPEIYGKAGAKDRFAFEEFEGGHEFNGALAFAFLQKYL